MSKVLARRILVGTTLVLAAAGSLFAAKPDEGPGAIVFLNRHGGTYRAGFDNAATNTSSIISGTRNISAFAGDDADWETVLEHARTLFRHFDVSIVDVEPAPTTHYIEAVVGGTPGQAGFSGGTLGVSPVYCAPAVTTIVYIFSALIPGENILTAETIAHEVGHAFSLDHEYLCKDPMTYLTGCGEKRFQNRTVACGEFAERGCFCDGGEQNSYAVLRDAFGNPGGPNSLSAQERDENPQPAWVCETPMPAGMAHAPSAGKQLDR
jgi:hypothetical protein